MDYGTKKFKKSDSTQPKLPRKRKPSNWNPQWEEDEDFKDWIEACEEDNRFYCKYCDDTFYFGQRSDLKRHAESVNHMNIIIEAIADGTFEEVEIPDDLSIVEKVKIAEMKISRYLAENRLRINSVDKLVFFSEGCCQVRS